MAKTDYQLLDINDEGFVSMMDTSNQAGDIREDLALPSATEEDQKLAEQIKADFEAGKDLVVRCRGRSLRSLVTTCLVCFWFVIIGCEARGFCVVRV